MEKRGDLIVYTQEESLDMCFGPIGTPQRDEYESEKQSYIFGDAVRQARKEQNLTQEQLAAKLGIRKAQISRIENGNSITLKSMTRIFSALGRKVNIEIEGIGKMNLC